jgi:pimeloyl-ACP methyl ester carboxylesterase
MLDQVQVPSLGMYGATDKVVDPDQWKPMQKGIRLAHIEHFSTCGHFPMLEEPADFSQKLKAFLDEEETPPS